MTRRTNLPGIALPGAGWIRRRSRRVAAASAALLLLAAAAFLLHTGGGGSDGDPAGSGVPPVPAAPGSGGCNGCSGKEGAIVPVAFDPRVTQGPQGTGSASSTGWSGRFVDAGGVPIPEARIQVIPPLLRDGGHFSPPWTADGTTGPQGEFQVLTETSVPPDAQPFVTIACEGGDPGRLLFHSRRVEWVPGHVVDLGELQAGSSGASYLVTVRDASGGPLPGARVRFVFPTGPLSGVTVETGDLGTAEAMGLACFGDTTPDHFRCYVENAAELASPRIARVEPSRVFARIGSRNVDFVVHFEDPPQMVPLAVLSYRGVADGRARGVLLGCEGRGVLQSYRGVQLVEGENPWPLGISKADSEDAEHFVEVYALDGSGEYLRAPIRPGAYQGMDALVAEASVWRRGVEVLGRLIRRDGSPAPDVSVFLQLPGGESLEGPRYREAVTDAGGRFAFHGLPPGTECDLAASADGVRRLQRIRVALQPPVMDLLDIPWRP